MMKYRPIGTRAQEAAEVVRGQQRIKLRADLMMNTKSIATVRPSWLTQQRVF